MAFTPQSNQVDINGNQYQLTAFYFPGHNTAWDDYYQAPFLGNFWQAKLTVTIDSVTANFHTAEAAFQATKWWYHDGIRKKFETATTGDEALRVKKSQVISPDYTYAGLYRDGAMLKVLEAKFADKTLQAGLLATSDAYLLEHNAAIDRDEYWSDNHDGTGKNMLGITLMSVRKGLGGQGDLYRGAVTEMTAQVMTK